MAWLGSPTASRSRRSPSSAGISRNWAGLTSWNSSTDEVPVAPAHPLGEAGVLVDQVGRPEQDVVEVEHPLAAEDVLVGARRHSTTWSAGSAGRPAGGRPPRRTTSGSRHRALAQPISVSTAEAWPGRRPGRRSSPVAVLGHLGAGPPGVEGMPAEQGEGQLVEGAGADARGRGAPGGAGVDDGHAVAAEPLAELVGRLAGEGADHRVVGLGRCRRRSAGPPGG